MATYMHVTCLGSICKLHKTKEANDKFRVFVKCLHVICRCIELIIKDSLFKKVQASFIVVMGVLIVQNACISTRSRSSGAVMRCSL